MHNQQITNHNINKSKTINIKIVKMYFKINQKKSILKRIRKIQIKKVEFPLQYKVLKIKYMIY